MFKWYFMLQKCKRGDFTKDAGENRKEMSTGNFLWDKTWN